VLPAPRRLRPPIPRASGPARRLPGPSLPGAGARPPRALDARVPLRADHGRALRRRAAFPGEPGTGCSRLRTRVQARPCASPSRLGRRTARGPALRRTSG
jgi:hypothetical protein